ncbi:unnamed protein product [Urochloa decumbens]|uniref:Bifunctional inhibitor/plant lipid transfer protein/seed storage helical domain-containing protein n=1 Tax=Urochloa decumbens TaxID=240449 RepID=A0ABC8YWW2_9POAL
MMSMKVSFQLLVFTMIFMMFEPQKVWGESEYYREKEIFKLKCMKTITIVGDYVHPSQSCVSVVKKYDMVRICRSLTPKDESEISVIKLLHLSRECQMPVPARTMCGTYEVPKPLHHHCLSQGHP